MPRRLVALVGSGLLLCLGIAGVPGPGLAAQPSAVGAAQSSYQPTRDTPDAANPDVWASVSVADQTLDTASHTCGIRTDGTLWCWGANAHGELGLGGTKSRYGPVQVGSDVDWAQVSAGWENTCAVTTAGSLLCWGAGYGTKPSQVGTGDTWARVAVGNGFRCALQTDGSLWCWGVNSNGQLGLGDTQDRDVPTQVGSDTGWTTVSTGDTDTCGVTADSSLWCWGSGLDGELGLGDGTWEVHVPTQVTGDGWDEVSTGASLTCGLKVDHTAYCWGMNDHGQLGTGDRAERTVPAEVDSSKTWGDIDVGGRHACAVGTDATLWCWGANDDGQLGTGGSTMDVLSPAQVGTLATWSRVGAGSIDSCALRSDASLWCWGSPDTGELGVGARTGDTTTPVQVGLPNPPPSASLLNGVDAISATDVWAVGDKVIGAFTHTLTKHFDGTSWQTVPSPNPDGPRDVLNSVSGTSPDDVWAVGTERKEHESAHTLTLHWDGTRWTVVPSLNLSEFDNTLTSVVALSPTDVWAVGSNRDGYVPLVEHWDGTTWSLSTTERGDFSWYGFASVTALSPTDIWAVGSGFQDEEAGWLTITEHWDGTSWTIASTEHHNRFADHFMNAVTAVSHSDVWAVGNELQGQGLIEHWTGHWTKLQHVPQLGGTQLDAAASTGPDDVWTAGKGGGHSLVLHWDGTTWTPVATPAHQAAEFEGASALTPTDAWIVGGGVSGFAVVEHWNGAAWQVSLGGPTGPPAIPARSRGSAAHGS